MDSINLDSLSLDEKLLLLEILSEKILEALPESSIAAQTVFHARYLNGKRPKQKIVRNIDKMGRR